MPDPVSDLSINEEVVPPVANEQTVAFGTYSKVLNQRKQDQARAKDAEERLAVLQAEKEANEQEALATQGKFQEMFEAEQKKTESLQANINSRMVADVERQKRNALKLAIGNVRKEEYLNFADINSIAIDESGNVDLDSVKEAASAFKSTYPDLLQAPSQGLPNGAPQKGQATKLTYADWAKLPAAEKRSRSGEVED